MDGKTLATPDFSPVQIASAITAIVGLFVSQGLIDNDRAQLITGLAAIVVPMIWMLADAIIRHGRARAFTNAPKPLEGGDA